MTRTGRSAITYRNIAVRWVRERPSTGFDPDVCLVEPCPPEGDELDSLLLWEPGRVPPFLAIEVVSKGHPYKDYAETPDKCAACGIREVVVFNPHLKGPRVGGGPHRLQVWRISRDRLERTYAGPGPAWCGTLDAWAHAVEGGKRLRFADDEAGTRVWLTDAETAQRAVDRQRAEADRQRAEADRQRAEADRQRAEAKRHASELDEAKQRIAELEREIAEKGRD